MSEHWGSQPGCCILSERQARQTGLAQDLLQGMIYDTIYIIYGTGELQQRKIEAVASAGESAQSQKICCRLRDAAHKTWTLKLVTILVPTIPLLGFCLTKQSKPRHNYSSLYHL